MKFRRSSVLLPSRTRVRHELIRSLLLLLACHFSLSGAENEVSREASPKEVPAGILVLSLQGTPEDQLPKIAATLSPGAQTVAFPLLYIPSNLSPSPWDAWFAPRTSEDDPSLDASRDNLFLGAWQRDPTESKPGDVGFQESLSTWTLTEGREVYPVYCWRNSSRLVLDQNFRDRKGILFDDLCWRAAGNFVRLHPMGSPRPSRPFFLLMHSLNHPEVLTRRGNNLESLRKELDQAKLGPRCRILLTSWPSETDEDPLSETRLRAPSLLVLASDDSPPPLSRTTPRHLSSLMPWLLGESPDATASLPSVPLFWKSTEVGQAVRLGNWKLVLPAGGDMRLHDLKEDPEEKDNLAQNHPEQVQALQALLQ